MGRTGALALLLLGCAPPPSAAVPSPAPIEPIRYELRVHADRIEVEATLPSATRLSLDAPVRPFVHDVQQQERGQWRALASVDDGWPVRCREGCRVRWSFALRDAALALDDHEWAQLRGGVILSPPGSYLLRPDRGARARFHVVCDDGVRFVTGVLPHAEQPDTYEVPLAYVADLPYTAIGAMRTVLVPTEGTSFELAVFGAELTRRSADGTRGDARLLPWIRRASSAITRYFGPPSLTRAALFVYVEEGTGVDFAMTMGNAGGSVYVRVGSDTDDQALARDWQLPHEMVHLAMPNLPERQRWLEEGLATYVEPLARVRAGSLTDEERWAELVRGIPFGLPQPGEGGLDDTPTWGRTYWGGALFCLLADLQIRARSGGRRSLDDALRAIVRAGGGAHVPWSFEEWIRVGDAATGGHELATLANQMATARTEVDVQALWQRLGVHERGKRVQLDDRAPDAALRLGMLREPRSPGPDR